MVLLRQPNPRFHEGERALGQPEGLLLQERQLLEYMFDAFLPNFAIVEACDHALLWAFILPTGACRGIRCFEHVRDYPGLREVLIHKTGTATCARGSSSSTRMPSSPGGSWRAAHQTLSRGRGA
ncbi:unnamed protein product [Trichogramma brassicae]|uniref:Uncharacterized protein n=1 Tax=Trichogramma brassicae TaxID=86971 RepID=A0A6H5IT56_9HYME|nr:unnamed protein product [Trichogramma brassicae]